MPTLHLLSTPGDRDIRWVVDACKPHLQDKDEPTIAFMPLASLNVNRWLDYTVRSFEKLARVELIDTDRMELPKMESILRKAHVVYISGGNTFLLNHRLHISGLMPYLRKKVQSGLPVVGFSAGMIVCGPNILTSKDMNSVETDHFDGLNASLFNFVAHYDADAYGQSPMHDDWLSEYHSFHDNPVIMLSDGAYVKVDGKKTTLVRGGAWVLRKDEEKIKVDEGESIVP
ncbi:MAG: Type 1 glutamine amidotransferase-like domain-containing protein [Anaerolineae bacterium]|nr:Type 1 glutamine amidotransferase-like domain-containing protein [Anaerolineae bacterium]MBL8106266.1 Type 1 glutamine amidotransferase-like domain-containing protein [Anaerolineales bacterium]MCC7187295.1 Type 1 glutamine amidotransferase-like domain-containing protein [Anaerolineales bacterium]